MKKASVLYDSRIKAQNVLVEMSIKEYENIVKDVLAKNEFQRRRVRSSKTIYALLKADLLRQCVIPPIVLALTKDVDLPDSDEDFKTLIEGNKEHLVILDGLQRTHTIFDLLTSLREAKDEVNLSNFLESKLRVELYLGLNRLGILYRMLTLNTGQTPMSLRQQIEMLYLDYLTEEINGIELIRESDGKSASRRNQYNFKDVIEGFNAYLDRDELPIDKADILENINSLEKLSKEEESTMLFEKYLEALDKAINKIVELCGDSDLSEEYLEGNRTPFGKNAIQIFKKPQSMSGLGAAIGKLIDFSIVDSIDEVIGIVDTFKCDDGEAFIENINETLLWLKDNSKKIGNAQRSFFTFFFRDILNSDSDSFADLSKANKSAFRKYQSQNT